MDGEDWYAWHDGYQDPDSTLARRLFAVQQRIRVVLDRAAPGRLRVLSLCAGQGRDLLGVLADHPRRSDVTARLVELDERNAAVAVDAASVAGLDRVEVVVGDAALPEQYADLAPADLVVACGIFGNLTEADIRNTVAHCARLCKQDGTVVWTRHRRPPDLVPEICRWFEDAGFTPEWVSRAEDGYGVAAHRFTREPTPLLTGERMFTFVR